MLPPKAGLPYAERAKELYEEIIIEEPSFVEASVRIGTLIFTINPLKGLPPIEGRDILEKVIQEYPQNAEARRNLGLLTYRISGADPSKLKKAIALLKSSIEIEPDVKALSVLIDIHISLKQKSNVELYLEQLESQVDSNDKFFQDFIETKKIQLKNL